MKLNKITAAILAGCLLLGGCGSGETDDTANTPANQNPTQFMDCILPMPIVGKLSKDCWGAKEVGARDQDNGIEDKELDNPDAPGTRYCYWDGAILKDDETGKYYMFASRWEESGGHWSWMFSKAIYATSDNLYGPYEDQGLCYPDIGSGDGHNVFPFKLAEGEEYNGKSVKYGIVLGDTANDSLRGGILVSDSLEGPWELVGKMQIKPGKASGGIFDLSNIGIIVTPDNTYYAYNRNGDIATADSIEGPWYTQVRNLWNLLPELTGHGDVEDPIMWYGNDCYNCVVNRWDEKKAYYMTSKDGIHGWRVYDGAAYMPDAEFTRYEDGTTNHWEKIERPNIYMEDGEIKAMTFAVIDVPKDEELGGDGHGSKVIVIPFDYEALKKLNENCAPAAY